MVPMYTPHAGYVQVESIDVLEGGIVCVGLVQVLSLSSFQALRDATSSPVQLPV